MKELTKAELQKAWKDNNLIVIGNGKPWFKEARIKLNLPPIKD